VLIINELQMRFPPSVTISLQVLRIKELQNREDVRAGPQCLGTNEPKENISRMLTPSILGVLYTRNHQQSSAIFGREQVEMARGCKAHKMNSLSVLSNNLTNIRSTCILCSDLGLEREN
jgi:hypothetical protein